MNRFGSELRSLVRLAVPIAAAQAGTQLMSVVDTAVVGRLGAVPLAAVGLGNSLFFTVAIVGIGIVMSIDPLAAQAVGAGDDRRARRLLWQGIWLSLIVTAVLGAIAALLPFAVRLTRVDRAVVEQGSLFLWIRLVGLAPTLLFIVARGYLQALHITRPMVTAMVAGNVFNFLADILFVFGGESLPPWCGALRHFPAMGVTGAAIATMLGTFLQLAIVAAAVRRVPRPGGAATARRGDAQQLKAALRVGLPVGLQMGLEYGIFALVGVLAGRFGARELAAHQTALTLISFSFTIAVGIGSAGAVRVGRAVGARDRDGVRRAGFAAFAAGLLVMSCAAVVFLAAPRFLAQMISPDPSVLHVAVPLLMVAAAFQLSDGIQGVGAGVLRGAGDTRYPFLANLVGHWCIGLPAALLFGVYLGGGVTGLWWGLSVGLTAVAAMLFLRFLSLSRQEIRPLHDATARHT